MICMIPLYPAYNKSCPLTGHVYSKCIIDRELISLINRPIKGIYTQFSGGFGSLEHMVGNVIDYTVGDTHFVIECDINDDFLNSISESSGMAIQDLISVAHITPVGFGDVDPSTKHVSPSYHLAGLVLKITSRSGIL